MSEFKVKKVKIKSLKELKKQGWFFKKGVARDLYHDIIVEDVVSMDMLPILGKTVIVEICSHVEENWYEFFDLKEEEEAIWSGYHWHESMFEIEDCDILDILY